MTITTLLLLTVMATPDALPSTPAVPPTLVIPAVRTLAYTCPTGYTVRRTTTGWLYSCEPLGDAVLNWMTVAYGALVVADIDLTLRLTQQGRGTEQNAVMRPMIRTPGGFAIKAALNTMLALAVYRFVPAQKRRTVMAFLLVVNAAAVAWNGYQYATHPWPAR